MKKTEKLYLVHIVEASARIREYLPKQLSEYEHNHLVQDAVIKVLGNVAESATKLEDQSKSMFPEIPWHMIKGLRNILVHDYLGDLDYGIVWKSLHEDLPILEQAARKILKEKYQLEL